MTLVDERIEKLMTNFQNKIHDVEKNSMWRLKDMEKLIEERASNEFVRQLCRVTG